MSPATARTREEQPALAGEAGPVAGQKSVPGQRLADPEAITLASDKPLTSNPSPVRSGPRPPAVARRAYRSGDVLTQRYQLIEAIGEGGMGEVWRARSLSLDLDVALKLIRPDTEVPYAAERLRKEARAAARVVHPAAVRVFDYSITELGDPFLVMELLTGTSLAERVAFGDPASPIEAVQLVLPVVGALVVAHREGIVHRDVKPANIMLVHDGVRIVPKLIDFGIASITAAARSKKLTANGMILGSPVYMAPEQVRGGGAGETDERTDVWAACTVLYELVAGKRPFGGKAASEIILDILYAPPARPAVLEAHPGLWSIIERGLAKSPGERWPTMIALGRALAAWAMDNGVAYDATGASLIVHWADRLYRV